MDSRGSVNKLVVSAVKRPRLSLAVLAVLIGLINPVITSANPFLAKAGEAPTTAGQPKGA